jgi:endonuclease YncB( thermonuclease family)
MTRLAPLALAVSLCLAAGPAAAQVQYDPFRTIEGFVQVLEGDLISVNGAIVRLYGIDAPELGQTCYSRAGRAYDCGEASRAVLDRLIGTAEVACTLYSRLSTREEVGRCFVGRTDIAGRLVRGGWAFTLPSLSNRYEGLQARAQARRAGLWSGQAARPWVWRSRQRLAEER